MKTSIHACCVSLLLLVPCSELIAQDDDIVSSDDIVKALEKPKTRGITRGIGVRANQSVDLNIPFDKNSSQLAPAAQRQLEQLSDALSNDSLGGYRFEIAGHTDASGAAEYNRNLSEQRAETVRRFLIDRGVNPQRLESAGHGEDRLLLPDEPGHPGNRRVEIRNLGET